MGRGKIMAINSHGERRKIDLADFNRSKTRDYKYDLAWDLSHGFTEANKAFGEIENS